MKRRIPTLVAAGALVILAAGCASGSRESAGQREELEHRAAALAFLDQFDDAAERSDPEVLAALCIDDGRFAWITDGEVRYHSPEEMVRGLEGVRAQGMSFETSYSDVDTLLLSARHALLTASFKTDATVTSAAGFTFAGVVTMILERSPDGEFRLVRGHTSTPAGPPQD